MTINTDFLLAPYNADKVRSVIPFDKIVMNIEDGGKVLPVEHRRTTDYSKFGFQFNMVLMMLKQALLFQSVRYFKEKIVQWDFSGNPETNKTYYVFK